MRIHNIAQKHRSVAYEELCTIGLCKPSRLLQNSKKKTVYVLWVLFGTNTSYGLGFSPRLKVSLITRINHEHSFSADQPDNQNYWSTSVILIATLSLVHKKWQPTLIVTTSECNRNGLYFAQYQCEIANFVETAEEALSNTQQYKKMSFDWPIFHAAINDIQSTLVYY